MQDQINTLTQRVETLERLLREFSSVSELDPQIKRTILTIIGSSLTLDSLSDVAISSPSVGQVIKYNGTEWANGTDNV